MDKQLVILSLAAASRVHPLLQKRARTHAVLVTGLYELIGNPTTQVIEPPGPLFIRSGNHTTQIYSVLTTVEHLVYVQFYLQ